MARRGMVGSLRRIAILTGAAIALVVVLISGCTRLIGGDYHTIPSTEMTPTLVPGDRILALPISRAVPERGTVVFSGGSKNPGADYVMRVIAFAGETVQTRGGVVHIDGQAAEMERLADRVLGKLLRAKPSEPPRCKEAAFLRGGVCIQERWRETLPDGTTQIVLNTYGVIGAGREIGYSILDYTRLLTVPEGHVFVLRDNRDNSIDRRFSATGMIPIDNLRHSAWIVHSSFDRSQGSWRPRFERFFKRIE